MIRYLTLRIDIAKALFLRKLRRKYVYRPAALKGRGRG